MEVMKVHPDATLPTRGTPYSAGLDLYALEDTRLFRGETTVVRTGIAIALPPNTVALIRDRSSLGRKGIVVSGGVVDLDYRGQILVCLNMLNIDGPQGTLIQKGERIAQLLIVPVVWEEVEEVYSLPETQRGDGGFGSTGK
jgi:dUTP pyrophosphatase